MSLVFKIVFLVIFAFPFSAFSKVIFEQYGSTENYTIKIEGYLTQSDLTDFQSAIKKLKQENLHLHLNVVQLNSIGGKPSAAIQIGELIRKHRLTTYIAPDSKCYSGCAYIFVGGVQRYAFGELGVHQFSITEKKEFTYKEIEDAYVNYNKEFKEYLYKMRTSENFQRLNYDTPYWTYGT
jgi:hypothetical protein